jgi:SAM-dependent methyltransferase
MSSSTVAGDQSSATPHLSDISASDLEKAMAAADHPDLLRRLVEISRRAFGFYTQHYQHTINYPWLAARLEKLRPGSCALDIGAGLNPLPLFLAERGVFVDCVDKHRLIRTPPVAADWNEWGFFDYRLLHPNLSAHHCDIADFQPSSEFAAIYSACAIAHMPSVLRQEVFRRCREWLRPGGTLLLALDLIPSSDFIWNLSEGQDVEPLLQHGTISDLLRQLTGLRFRVYEQKVIRAIYRARTDLLFVDAIRS